MIPWCTYPSSYHTIALSQSGMKKLLARQAPVDTPNDEGAGDNSRSFQWPQRTRLLAAIPRFAPLAIRLELEPGMLALASLPSQQHQYPGEALGRRVPSPSSLSPRVRVGLVCTSPSLPPGSQHPSQRTSGPLRQKTRATHQPSAPPPSSWQVDTGPVLRRKCPCAIRSSRAGAPPVPAPAGPGG